MRKPTEERKIPAGITNHLYQEGEAEFLSHTLHSFSMAKNHGEPIDQKLGLPAGFVTTYPSTLTFHSIPYNQRKTGK